MLKTIRKFGILLEKEEKRRAALLLLIATAGAFFEMLSVSLMVPLMSAILEPDIIQKNPVIGKVCSFLRISEHRDFIVLCILAIAAVYIIKSLFLVYRRKRSASFVYQNRFRMQQKMLKAYLQKPYAFFLNAHSGEILRVIQTDTQNACGLLDMLLSLISESIVSAAVIAVIFLISPVMTLLIAGAMSLILLFVARVVKPVLRREGLRYRESVARSYNWLLQTVGGIKEIKAGCRESFFEGRFAEAGCEQTEAEKRYSLLMGVPRIIIELGSICSALLAMLIMILTGSATETLVPAFSALAMAAVKLLPAFNRIINSASAIAYNGPTLDKLIENLSETVQPETPSLTDNGPLFRLQDKVELRQISFRYTESAETVLENASMVIPAGCSVGISGLSGAGKTTAADILLGLLKPESGDILCDGRSITENYRGWLRLAAYIPQSIFMLDGSIRDNVVFGSPASDDEKIWKALEAASLAAFVQKQPAGLDTEIGERGIKLSGGQRQRIGIARALYTDPELLILDEATAALDTETEGVVMDAIRSLQGKKTLVIIAHRLSTIENCDIRYFVQDKSIIRVPE